MKLKLAIVAAEKSQRQVALETNGLLTENRLSEIVCGWIMPRDDEKAALARVLQQPVDALFEQSGAPAAWIGQSQREHANQCDAPVGDSSTRADSNE